MTTTFSYATMHSIERAKERMGYNEKNAHRQINRALERGKRAEDFSSWERNYLESECGETTVAIAYNGFCYIVSNTGACLTMYELPTWFGKKKHFDGKEKIRNMKAYSRNYITDKQEYAFI